MSDAATPIRNSLRWRRLVGISLLIASGLLGLFLGGSLFSLAYSEYDLWMPYAPRPYVRVGLVVMLGILFVIQPSRIARVAIPSSFWTRAQILSERLMDRWISLVLIAALALMLALWLPHFLTWPIWSDIDHFALAAHSWDVGRLPYRDQLDFNFPGPMFLMWVIGKTFGWDAMMPAMALDAAMLIGLGFAMSVWSRDRFGKVLPGLAGIALFYTYYLSLDATLVAQRDWQAMWMVVLSLMTIECCTKARAAWITAAFLVALAFSFRPYPVLFLPAFLSAIDGRIRSPGEPLRRSVRATAWFGLTFALMLILVFSPLWTAGILDDFVRSLAYVVPGGAYNQNSPIGFRTKLLNEMTRWQIDWLLLPLLYLSLSKSERLNRTARTWTLALIGGMFYRPLGPVPHHYLVIPVQLLLAFALAVIFAAVLNSNRVVRPTSRLLSIIVIFAWYFPGMPRSCDWTATIEALACELFGTPPKSVSIGMLGLYHTQEEAPLDPNWESYLALLDYLRETTTEKTLIANTLRKHPYFAINGPLGRLSPYPTAANMLWFRWVGLGREPEFSRALIEADDVVVVWCPEARPDQHWMRLEPLVETIREYFRPVAKFGVLEVWRRIPKGTIPEPLPPYIPDDLERRKDELPRRKIGGIPNSDKRRVEIKSSKRILFEPV